MFSRLGLLFTKLLSTCVWLLTIWYNRDTFWQAQGYFPQNEDTSHLQWLVTSYNDKPISILEHFKSMRLLFNHFFVLNSGLFPLATSCTGPPVKQIWGYFRKWSWFSIVLCYFNEVVIHTKVSLLNKLGLLFAKIWFFSSSIVMAIDYHI